MATKTTKRTKTTTDAAGRPLYLLVQEDRSNHFGGERYYHLQGRVTTQRYENLEYLPYSPDDEYSNGPLWNSLRVSCQGDEQSRRRAIAGEAEPVYGFDTEYHDVHRVNKRRATRMAKTLETLDTRLGKMTETRGYLRSYGEYVGRVAEALGCEGIVIERTARSQGVTGQRWQWDTIGDGVNKINRLIDAWVDEARPKVPEPEPPAAGGWTAEDDAARDAQGVQ